MPGGGATVSASTVVRVGSGGDRWSPGSLSASVEVARPAVVVASLGAAVAHNWLTDDCDQTAQRGVANSLFVSPTTFNYFNSLEFTDLVARRECELRQMAANAPAGSIPDVDAVTLAANGVPPGVTSVREWITNPGSVFTVLEGVAQLRVEYDGPGIVQVPEILGQQVALTRMEEEFRETYTFSGSDEVSFNGEGEPVVEGEAPDWRDVAGNPTEVRPTWDGGARKWVTTEPVWGQITVLGRRSYLAGRFLYSVAGASPGPLVITLSAPGLMATVEFARETIDPDAASTDERFGGSSSVPVAVPGAGDEEGEAGQATCGGDAATRCGPSYGLPERRVRKTEWGRTRQIWRTFPTPMEQPGRPEPDPATGRRDYTDVEVVRAIWYVMAEEDSQGRPIVQWEGGVPSSLAHHGEIWSETFQVEAPESGYLLREERFSTYTGESA